MSQNNQRSGNIGDKNTAIEATNVALTYPDGTEAVRNVSATIPEGEFFGFLGPNGAGKTTTIKTFVTLLRPTRGNVCVYGSDVENKPRTIRGDIGYMAQETSIDPTLTARENLRFACKIQHVPKAERTNRINELLDLVGLNDVADTAAKTFSGGMQKRLDVATVLVHHPPLVFLDEPTTGLDPRSRNRLWDYFREINAQGTTVFLTTQYLEEADQLCDRLAVIADGEIIATGTPNELKAEVGGDVLEVDLEDTTSPHLEQSKSVLQNLELGGSDASVTITNNGLMIRSGHVRHIGNRILIALQESGRTVTGFDIRSPTLDEVFLAVTDERTDIAPDNNGRQYNKVDSDSAVRKEDRSEQ